jgi:ferredoxin-NADP reductase
MKVTLTEKHDAVPGVVTFILQPEQPVTWEAGQYMHYVMDFPDPDDRGVERWFTIASAPYEGHLQITTRINAERSSTFKTTLNRLPTGSQWEADGPEGDFTVEDADQHHIFISGGIGITPFHSILKQLDHNGKPLKATLLYANRTPDFVFKNELDAWEAKHEEFSVVYIQDPQRIDEQVIRDNVEHLDKHTFYVSGPEPMVMAMAETLKGMSISEKHIKLDDFPGYDIHD